MSLSAEEEEWLEQFLDTVEMNPRLSKWETGFVDDQREALSTYGAAMHVSRKQWTVMRRIGDKVGFDTSDAGIGE